MLALFEKYSQTSDKPKSKITPISVKKGAPIVFKTILNYLEKEEYGDIETNKNFNEIYCCDRDYEITISVFDEGNYESLINISVYGEKKRGRTRGKLKAFRNLIIDLFIDDIEEP